MAKVRLGIIGCGWAGERCARAAEQLGNRVQVVAAVDSDGQKARDAARRWNAAHAHTDYAEALSSGIADAVAVCLPHSLHAEVSIAALDAGLHVLVEKPLAVAMREADAMVARAGSAGRCLMVAETVRFEPAFEHVAEIVRTGRLGRVFLIRVERLHQMHGFLRSHPWFLSDPGGGIMMSGGIHDFEIVRMIGGEIEHVYAMQGPKALPEMKADDTSVALARLESGATAVVVESFSARNHRAGLSGSVHGSLGSVWFDRTSVHLYGAEEDGHPEQLEVTEWESSAGFDATLQHFLDSIESGTEPKTGGRDQRRPLLAVLSAYASMRSGQPVRLSDLERGRIPEPI